MDIITISPPRLDPNDIHGSFQRMGDYFREVMELIDYTLGRYGGKLRTVDADGVAESLNEFRAGLVNLQRDLAGQDNEISALGRNIESAEGRLNVLEAAARNEADRLSALETRADAAEKQIADLEKRVETLEDVNQ